MKEQCEHEGTVARVEDCINLDSLPHGENRSRRVLESFDRIKPGHSLIVIDDYQLEWLEDLLEEERPGEFDRRFFHLHEEAGRNEACLKKRTDAVGASVD